MSFALKVKEEIISHDFNDEQQKAFLSGFIKQNGELVYSNQSKKLKLTTISNRIARTLISFLKKHFDISIDISIVQSQTLKKQKSFNLFLIGNIDQLLYDLVIVDLNQNHQVSLNELWLKEQSYLRSYISGVFIACGSVNSPKTSNYHLELNFQNELDALYTKDLLQEYNFDFKLLQRNEKHFILYLKKAILVSDFLKFIDAPISVMEFENERISRDMVNNINRISNIDISNQSKVLKTATDQIDKIKYLQKRGLLTNLSDKAQLIAKIRLKKPELSYNELENELAKHQVFLTKSGIAYLFRSIYKLYDKTIEQERKEYAKSK